MYGRIGNFPRVDEVGGKFLLNNLIAMEHHRSKKFKLDILKEYENEP